jgi:kynurenine formamidase
MSNEHGANVDRDREQTATGGASVIDLSRYRVVDLSVEVLPAERKVDGRYAHGDHLWGRTLEVDEYIAYAARMHLIRGHTHGGTHAEAPYKYAESGLDIGSMPVAAYLGEAAVCDFSGKEPGESVTPADLSERGVRPDDVVLAWANPATEQGAVYLSVEAVDWLIDTQIKLMAVENLHLAPPGTPVGPTDGDGRLLLAGIGLIDGVVGLDQLTKQRVFFIALPIKMRRVTACWTRAIALEPLDN